MPNTKPKLVWDQIGEKLWETGVDRVVLFPMTAQGGHANGVAWSGITAINESPSGAEPTKIYADNIVYGVVMSPEEDALTVEAFTYPDEYAECIGEASVGEGAVIKQQSHKHFGLAYRTMIGNDTVGTEHGYKIHIFWDCVAGASEDSNSTINDSPEQKTFSWSVTTLPVAATGFQPTASMGAPAIHIFFPSTFMVTMSVFSLRERSIKEERSTFPRVRRSFESADLTAAKVPSASGEKRTFPSWFTIHTKPAFSAEALTASATPFKKISAPTTPISCPLS